MIKNKKWYLGVLTLASITAPIASVIACGTETSNNISETPLEINQKTATNVQTSLNGVTSSTLPYTNAIFAPSETAIAGTPQVAAAALGLVIPSSSFIWSQVTELKLYVTENNSDTMNPQVTVIAQIMIGTNVNLVSTSTTFTITNFSSTYNLSTFGNITAMRNDANLIAGLVPPKTATAAQITTAIQNISIEYLNAILPQTLTMGTDYNLTNIQLASGAPIPITSDLSKNSSSYNITIVGAQSSGVLRGSQTITVTLPQLDLFDLATITGPDLTRTLTANDVTPPPSQSAATSDWITTAVTNLVLDIIDSTATSMPTINDFSIQVKKDASTVLPATTDLTTAQSVVAIVTAYSTSQNITGTATFIVNLPVYKASYALSDLEAPTLTAAQFTGLQTPNQNVSATDLQSVLTPILVAQVQASAPSAQLGTDFTITYTGTMPTNLTVATPGAVNVTIAAVDTGSQWVSGTITLPLTLVQLPYSLSVLQGVTVTGIAADFTGTTPAQATIDDINTALKNAIVRYLNALTPTPTPPIAATNLTVTSNAVAGMNLTIGLNTFQAWVTGATSVIGNNVMLTVTIPKLD